MAAKRKYTRLTDEQKRAIAEELRLARYYRPKAIAARYGIPPNTIFKIQAKLRERDDSLHQVPQTNS